MFHFLRNRYVQIGTALLLAQLVAYYGLAQSEVTPYAIPLKEFPRQLGVYALAGDAPIDEASLGVLAPDDHVSRTYQAAGSQIPVNLFIAYFRSQRHGFAPHSPKNCLPGAGWKQISASVQPLAIANATPIDVNHYVVEKDGRRMFVLYWFQQAEDSFHDELTAQFSVLPRLLLHQRTDTALARVIVPGDGATAVKEASAFAQELYPAMRRQFP
jgi:EpsI family protein